MARRRASYVRAINTRPKDGEFAYSDAENPINGLRLCEDTDARAKLFRGPFNGPLAIAFESSRDLEPPMGEILPENYPYHTCRADPFPDGERSMKCPYN
jgi:hypothetical protein